MFFKNLLIYRLTQDINLDVEALEAALATKPAREPASQEIQTYGFIAPFGKNADAPLVHVCEGYLLLATRKAERNLPGSTVRDEVKAKIEDIEEKQSRKVYKRERDEIKDNVIQEFLPRAFVRRKATFAAIDPKSGLIYVNSGSARDAEDFLSTLREVIGSLPVRPMTVKVAPSATLTDWLKTKTAGDNFYVLDECTLVDTQEDGGVANLKRQDLTGEEAAIHLLTGKIVTKLAVAYKDHLSFLIDDKMVIRRLRFEDLIQEQAAQDGGEEESGQFDASFVLMMLIFREFVPALIDAMGGEEIPQGLDSPGAEQATPKPKRVVNEVQLDAFELPPTAFDDGSSSDTLYAEAVNFVRESRRASISAVQRKLKIGYNRAARMIEQMEDTGIVTAMNTNGSREVIQ